jgi:LysR family transcriptional regulator, transcription activator of glutamate synthase operon
MELFQLKYFVNIADTLSFTRSAELLHVSQPALTYQMQRLERELGVPLFDRDHRKIKLTPSGEVFLPLAQAVLFRADEAIRVLKEHMGVEAGEVRMGCNPSVATYAAPRLLATFRTSYPRVTVELIEGGDADLARAVLEGTLDFAVVTASGSPTTLDTTLLATEELLVVAPPGHPLAGRRSVALRELAQEAFLFPSESFNVTVQVMEACRSAGFEPRVPYRTGSVESVKNFVRQGLGISILPAMTLGELGGGGLAALKVEGGMNRDLNLIQAKDRSPTGAARALMQRVQIYLSGAAD